MRELLIAAAVTAVLVDLVSLNLLAGLARVLPVERRLRRASRRPAVAAVPPRLRQLEALVGDLATNDPAAGGRVASLLDELAGPGGARVVGRLDLRRLGEALDRIEAGRD